MQPIIYDVAVSADGFISGPQDDVSAFPTEGTMVDDYFERLSTYHCAIMGRSTYEFGYKHGLEPGQNPYPHMRTLVFSGSLNLPGNSCVEIVRRDAEKHIQNLIRTADGPIYLCGGGKFAGALLERRLIDILRLKRAPTFLGDGTAIFAGQKYCEPPRHIETITYGNGFIFQEFELVSKHGLRIPNSG